LSEFPRNKARKGLPPVDDLDEPANKVLAAGGSYYVGRADENLLRGRLTATPLLRHEPVETRSSAMEGSAPVCDRQNHTELLPAETSPSRDRESRHRSTAALFESQLELASRHPI
jgi:hypothetical protein